MRVNELTDTTLRSLSEVEADEPVVVSVFVNLDPSQYATAAARESQVNSLLNALAERIRDGELSHDARAALEADRERIEAFLREEMDPSQAAALAIYSAHALDFFEVVKLAMPVDADVRIDLRPILEPVLGHEDEGTWCVLLVTRDTGRIFRGGPTGIREIRDLRSDVKNQHQAGGWSQARYERSVEQDVERHLEAVAELVFAHHKRRPFEHLIVGANNESLRPAFTGEAHAYLRERIRGWVDIDEQLASEEEVFEAVRHVMEEHLGDEERALFERFEAERGTGGRAAEGVDDILAALAERRVETLILREDARAEGVKCVTCGWLGPAGLDRCPVDDTALDRIDNIIEPAIQAAIQQAAGVQVVRADTQGEDDVPFDAPVAAILRY